MWLWSILWIPMRLAVPILSDVPPNIWALAKNAAIAVFSRIGVSSLRIIIAAATPSQMAWVSVYSSLGCWDFLGAHWWYEGGYDMIMNEDQTSAKGRAPMWRQARAYLASHSRRHYHRRGDLFMWSDPIHVSAPTGAELGKEKKIWFLGTDSNIIQMREVIYLWSRKECKRASPRSW